MGPTQVWLLHSLRPHSRPLHPTHPHSCGPQKARAGGSASCAGLASTARQAHAPLQQAGAKGRRHFYAALDTGSRVQHINCPASSAQAPPKRTVVGGEGCREDRRLGGGDRDRLLLHPVASRALGACGSERLAARTCACLPARLPAQPPPQTAPLTAAPAGRPRTASLHPAGYTWLPDLPVCQAQGLPADAALAAAPLAVAAAAIPLARRFACFLLLLGLNRRRR